MNLRLALFGIVAVSVLAGPALADPRQDVIAGAQRCAGIADNRTWLDCFYGSAQPMRAALGLPPAPANQQRLVPPGMAVPGYAAPAPAYAPPAYAPPTYAAPPAYAPPAYAAPAQPAYAPPAQPNYPAPAYGIGAQAYNATPVAPPANVQNAGPVAPPPLPRRRGTGFFGSIFGDSKPVTSNQRMVSWTTGKGGRFIVTLSNGEVWAQDDGDENTAKWRGAANRFVVNVYEGALGTYNMNVSDDSTLYKVHRVN